MTVVPAPYALLGLSGLRLELGIQIDALGYRDVGYILGLRFLGTRTQSGSLPRTQDFEA